MAKKTRKAKAKMPKSNGDKSVQKAQRDSVVPELPVGTKLQKLDREGKVRCECTVEEGGYRYGKTVFRSLTREGHGAPAIRSRPVTGPRFFAEALADTRMRMRLSATRATSRGSARG